MSVPGRNTCPRQASDVPKELIPKQDTYPRQVSEVVSGQQKHIRDKFLRCPKCVSLGQHTYLRGVSEAPEVSSFGGKTRIRDKFLRCPNNQIPKQSSHLKQFSEGPEVSSLWAKHIAETSFWGAQNVKSRGNTHIRDKFLRNPNCLILKQNTYLRQVSQVPKVSSLWAKHVSQTGFWGAQSV